MSLPPWLNTLSLDATEAWVEHAEGVLRPRGRDRKRSDPRVHGDS